MDKKPGSIFSFWVGNLIFQVFQVWVQVPNLIFSGFSGSGSGTEPDFFRFFGYRFRVVNRVTYPNLKPGKKSGTNTWLGITN
jgi:hypothetical protein